MTVLFVPNSFDSERGVSVRSKVRLSTDLVAWKGFLPFWVNIVGFRVEGSWFDFLLTA